MRVILLGGLWLFTLSTAAGLAIAEAGFDLSLPVWLAHSLHCGRLTGAAAVIVGSLAASGALHRFGWAMCALTFAGAALNYSGDRALFHSAMFPETLLLPPSGAPEHARLYASVHLTAVDRAQLALMLAARLVLIASGLRALGPAIYRKWLSIGTR